jgi:hypothetical protein
VTFEANLAFGSIFPVVRLPVSGVRPDATALVALHAHITFGVTGGAGLQVAACLYGMFGNGCRRVPLGAETKVRFDSHAPFGEPVMALGALLLLMAAIAALRVAGGLDRVDAEKIASVAAWREVTA